MILINYKRPDTNADDIVYRGKAIGVISYGVRLKMGRAIS